MEDKKVLQSEELNKVSGGMNDKVIIEGMNDTVIIDGRNDKVIIEGMNDRVIIDGRNDSALAVDPGNSPAGGREAKLR